MRHTLSVLIAAAATTTPALADVPKVVTDFIPAQGLVALVMEDLGPPDMLLGQGANGHDLQLRPSQTAALARADLVVWIGPEMSPWLDRTLEGLGNVPQLRLLSVPGTHLRSVAGAGATNDDADDPAEEEGDHHHSGVDPHAWLDPGNAPLWLDAIAAELARLDPANAVAYADNADRAKAALAATDAEIAHRLAAVRDRPFVVFHDAYGYFSAHYGLTVAGSVAPGDGHAPGAAHLAELRARVVAGAVCLFPETGRDPAYLEQLAEGTDVRIGASLDPEGMAVAPGPDAYPALLRQLADTLLDCLGQG
ncbi:MAG: zinc ABC transporter substrate-binding protein [Gemmobacter sp.]|jgi:zinc transport system substrate-binding protein|nr:zinc ABC transporter substrate-binding protein [Gemmobacter sp.]